MPDLPLTFALGTTERLHPITDGDVRPEGIELHSSVERTGEIFWAMPLTEPWDVCEMSLTGYLWSIQHGKRWIAIPVFPGWVFSCHADTLVHVNSGIERPEDLKGKRVGVPEYAVTAIAWSRDTWEQENGVRHQDILWCEERTAKGSHYRPSGYAPPSDIPVEIIPEEKCLCDMLIAGELDAVTRYFGGPGRGKANGITIDRSYMAFKELAASEQVRWLYPDRKAAALASFKRIGWPQPIHTVVIKQEIVDQYPWVPKSLYDAFAEASRRTAEDNTLRTSFPFPAVEEHEVVGPDFSPVGMSAGNRRMVERMLDISQKDGFILPGRTFTVDELFEKSTLDLA